MSDQNLSSTGNQARNNESRTVGVSLQLVLADIAAGLRRAVFGIPTAEARAAIDGLLPAGHLASRFLRHFVALTVCCRCRSLPSRSDDPASVVIGAMLVAPLMTPILGASASVVQAHNRRLFWALEVIAAGTVLAVGVGSLVSALAAQSIGEVLELPNKVRSRTAPGLLDLGVALTAGAAAGYVARGSRLSRPFRELVLRLRWYRP